MNNSTVDNSTVDNSRVDKAKLNVFRPFVIIGSLWSVCESDEKGNISIGCKKFHIDEWLKTYKEVAKEQNASDATTKEYALHLKYMKKLISLRNNA